MTRRALTKFSNRELVCRRMRGISRKKLRLFWEKHGDAEQALRAWFHEARGATWKSFNDIKSRYRSADLLPGNRVVFAIKGNTYRLIVRIHFNTGIVFVRFVGTHAEYDRIDASSISPTHDETESAQD